MKITYKGDYAFKAILDLAVHNGEPQKIEAIAMRQDIPVKFLEQILLHLKNGRYVKSLRGKSGGYLLAKKPNAITLGEIIRFIEGPIEPISCIAKHAKSHCNFEPECVFVDIFRKIADDTAKVVDGVSFEDLKHKAMQKKAKGKKYLSYNI